MNTEKFTANQLQLRDYVITINCLWTFSVFTCTLSFVLFLNSALSFENRFACTFHVLNIFLWNQLPHLFHLLEEVGVVVLLRSLRTETRIIITIEEAEIRQCHRLTICFYIWFDNQVLLWDKQACLIFSACKFCLFLAISRISTIFDFLKQRPYSSPLAAQR